MRAKHAWRVSYCQQSTLSKSFQSIVFESLYCSQFDIHLLGNFTSSGRFFAFVRRGRADEMSCKRATVAVWQPAGDDVQQSWAGCCLRHCLSTWRSRRFQRYNSSCFNMILLDCFHRLRVRQGANIWSKNKLLFIWSPPHCYEINPSVWRHLPAQTWTVSYSLAGGRLMFNCERRPLAKICKRWAGCWGERLLNFVCVLCIIKRAK